MNTTMLTRARRLFAVSGVPVHTQRHNVLMWARSVRMLGDNWVLKRPLTQSAQPAVSAKKARPAVAKTYAFTATRSAQ